MSIGYSKFVFVYFYWSKWSIYSIILVETVCTYTTLKHIAYNHITLKQIRTYTWLRTCLIQVRRHGDGSSGYTLDEAMRMFWRSVIVQSNRSKPYNIAVTRLYSLGITTNSPVADHTSCAV